MLPFELMVPKTAKAIPMAPDWSFEPKWDGYRVAVIVAGGVQIVSRRGTDLTSIFPDLAAASDSLPDGTVLDAEAVVFTDGRLNFDALQHRMASRRKSQTNQAPATLVAFDLLLLHGEDLRTHPWSQRRTQLEHLAEEWVPPLHVTPTTDDRATAMEWMKAMAPIGIEGIVAKRTAGPYGHPGSWIKIKHRETLEGVIGAVIGPLHTPEALIVGHYPDDTEELAILGRTTQLSPTDARHVGDHLRDAGPDHPWPDQIGGGSFGSGPVDITRVDPTVVVEVSADTATQAGRRRHALRYLRLRLDTARPSE